jgi:hypothetical protein
MAVEERGEVGHEDHMGGVLGEVGVHFVRN